MKVETQALVADVGEDRKRWVVLLALVLGAEQVNIEHPSGEVDPGNAITEAVRKHVPYAHSFRAATAGKTTYVEGKAVAHPSVENGWLLITLFTEGGLELTNAQARVRLQGHGGARETSLETAETMEELLQ